MRPYQYQFEAPVEHIKYGRMFYGGVFMPSTIFTALPQARERGFRLVGEVGGLVSEFGLMAVKTLRFIVLSQSFLVQSKLKTGDIITVRFSPIDPENIDVPIELEQALKTNRAAGIVWSNLTSGKKREFAFRVASAEQEVTRLKRAYQLIEKIMDSPS